MIKRKDEVCIVETRSQFRVKKEEREMIKNEKIRIKKMGRDKEWEYEDEDKKNEKIRKRQWWRVKDGEE